MKNSLRFFDILFLIVFLCSGWVFAGQTGKIAGKITDSSSGEPLPGANVIIEGTNLGAASDVDGDFLILNLPPGTYILTASMLGYQDVRMTQVAVQADRSTRVDFHLQPASLELGEIITVEAERPIIQKDLTATASSVSSDEIENIPVENLQDLLVLQAGVVADKNGELHIRGGRSSEIAYLVDGVSVTDPFSGKKAIDIDQNNIQELKVISGTFNAEYGQVMSGIVEVVTKDPEDQTRTGLTVYSGDYLSSQSSLFFNINTVKPVDIYNLQFYITGPLPLIKKGVGYYLSLRNFYNDGWLYGVRRYNPSDSAHFEQDGVYIEQTGDNQPVPMNFSREYYGNLKLVFKLSNTAKLSYSLLGNNFSRRFYNHLFHLNPDGDKTNYNYGISNMLNLNHTLSPRTFYTLKLSHFDYQFKSYLYEDPNDPRYVNPELLMTREDAFSFLTGGSNMIHENRSSTVNNGKFDITSQVSKIHQLKSGIEIKHTRIEENNFEANYHGIPNGGIFSTFSFLNSGKYHHNAVEASAYLQDKIELNNMTVNIGLRYDYFDSRGVVPRFLNDPDSAFNQASVKHQFSPRIGLAFPISSAGVIHTSYGHFFQIPPYEFLYQNPRFAVNPGGLSTLLGNADLKPQTTIIYEFGIQQVIFPQVGIDVTGFYKDARNLLGTKIYNAGGGDRYARYENRDYGNIRGITFSLNKRPTASDHVTVSFDYTFQVAEGNASDPNQEFYNQQSEPPKKSNIQVVPLNWDQTHTVNLSLSYSHPKILTAGIIGQFQSGLPYTPAIQSLETTFENSGRKPFNYNVDLRLSKILPLWGQRFELFLKVYNLFDRRNELDVYQDTGRAGYSLVSHYTGERNAHVNTLGEWLQRPEFYSEPRKVLFGLRLDL
ncbi:hypothetical protein B1H10_00045 [candidate division KSB1 bacterium 4484_188]|nr:MAG: hypothetical protein B1H10_00045 [candidate division KSB1 bacterium 4484_188]